MRTPLRSAALASRNRIDLYRIRRWSRGEGHAARFEEFRRELAQWATK